MYPLKSSSVNHSFQQCNSFQFLSTAVQCRVNCEIKWNNHIEYAHHGVVKTTFPVAPYSFLENSLFQRIFLNVHKNKLDHMYGVRAYPFGGHMIYLLSKNSTVTYRDSALYPSPPKTSLYRYSPLNRFIPIYCHCFFAKVKSSRIKGTGHEVRISFSKLWQRCIWDPLKSEFRFEICENTKFEALSVYEVGSYFVLEIWLFGSGQEESVKKSV